MTTDLVTTNTEAAAIIERVMLVGDLAKLSPAERVSYYRQTCESLGLNPLTRPFEYITLNGKLTLYARKDATEQLRNRHNVSVAIVGRELVEGVYVVTARATLPNGRTDESIGAVAVEGVKGEARANSYMKAETKAKRRVTLSVVGLGWLDETEVSSIPDARPTVVDVSTGEILTGKSQANGATPRDVAEAKERFWARYGKTIGGDKWIDVANYLDVPFGDDLETEPETVQEWLAAARAVRAKEQKTTEPRTQEAVV